jgi:hypothetical protein
MTLIIAANRYKTSFKNEKNKQSKHCLAFIARASATQDTQVHISLHTAGLSVILTNLDSQRDAAAASGFVSLLDYVIVPSFFHCAMFLQVLLLPTVKV